MKTFLIIVVLFLFPFNSFAQTVTVTVNGLRSTKGQLILYIFRDQQSFKDNKPIRQLKYPKRGASKESLTFSVELALGRYGFSIVDDENANAKMDYNMLGMPKEGFGFSDYYHSSLSRPVFSDFQFDMKTDKKIVVKMRYL